MQFPLGRDQHPIFHHMLSGFNSPIREKATTSTTQNPLATQNPWGQTQLSRQPQILLLLALKLP